MPDELRPAGVMRQISDLEARIGELRLSVTLPQVDLRGALDAALEELDLALSALRTLGKDQVAATGGRQEADTERRMLKTIFTDAPIPLFLLDGDGTVRRVNRGAAALLGTSAGYVAGKPFPILCDLQTRAALRSQLSAVVRTGRRRHVNVSFLGRDASVESALTLARVWIKGEPEPMLVAAAVPRSGKLPVPRDVEEVSSPDDAVVTLTHRMDLLSSATELLLEGPQLNESIAVRRCARLLAAELADWVIVDVERAGVLGRRVVFGPDDEHVAELTRTVENLDPLPGGLPHSVYEGRRPSLIAHVDDLGVLGVTPDGLAVCGLMAATSLLSVPIDDGDRPLGAITLASTGEQGQFDLLDLGVMQRLGRQLGLVVRAAREYRRRTEVAEALQASLLPRELPVIPGLDLAARYAGATQDVKVGGDFYDVFPTPAGWGFVLGDVSGKGEEAAAVTATARHGVRLLSRWKDEPGEVLSMVNETLLSEKRFVTAVYAGLPKGPATSVTLASAGHPPVVIVRADGAVRTASGGGVPLGLFEDFEPAVESLELGEGDTLFLHSDGVLDACDEMRERFGHERLIEVLAAHRDRPVAEMLYAVEQALLAFCSGDLADDLSMLALRVLPQTLN